MNGSGLSGFENRRALQFPFGLAEFMLLQKFAAEHVMAARVLRTDLQFGAELLDGQRGVGSFIAGGVGESEKIMALRGFGVAGDSRLELLNGFGPSP